MDLVVTPPPGRSGAGDPLVARRARIARLAAAARRLGYGCLVVAVVGFAVAVVGGFPPAAVTATVAGLVGSCIVLPPALIVGYGVAKATREDPG